MGETTDPRLDAAITRLRVLTRGSKGDREDYLGHVSTADATLIVEFIDRAKPLYDAHAFGKEELRYLHAYRRLPLAAREELDRYLTYLARRNALAARTPSAVPTGEPNGQ